MDIVHFNVEICDHDKSFQGLLFALFTSIMFGTQVRLLLKEHLTLHFFKVSAIWYDETGIESLKKEEVRFF